jgi:hypothetical protein
MSPYQMVLKQLKFSGLKNARPGSQSRFVLIQVIKNGKEDLEKDLRSGKFRVAGKPIRHSMPRRRQQYDICYVSKEYPCPQGDRYPPLNILRKCYWGWSLFFLLWRFQMELHLFLHHQHLYRSLFRCVTFFAVLRIKRRCQWSARGKPPALQQRKIAETDKLDKVSWQIKLQQTSQRCNISKTYLFIHWLTGEFQANGGFL